MSGREVAVARSWWAYVAALALWNLPIAVGFVLIVAATENFYVGTAALAANYIGYWEGRHRSDPPRSR